MHAFLRLIRSQVEDAPAAWARLVEFAHDGDVYCRWCRERICEQLPATEPPYVYRCSLCDRGAPALGKAASDLDLSLGPWRAYLDTFSLRLAFGPKSAGRPSGVSANRLRRAEAIRDEVDRFVTRQPDATAALFGLLELPDPVPPSRAALEPRQEMGQLIRLPVASQGEA